MRKAVTVLILPFNRKKAPVRTASETRRLMGDELRTGFVALNTLFKNLTYIAIIYT